MPKEEMLFGSSWFGSTKSHEEVVKMGFCM